MLALLKSGDHVLVVENAYSTTREFCQSFLSRMGISHALIPADAVSIGPWLTPATRLVLLESPGSYTMEVQDIERIASEARGRGAWVAIDNAWGLGLTRPFDHGVDIVCSALSKYAGGHSDVCMGSVTVTDRRLYEHLKTTSFMLGEGVSSDDASLVLRGLQTLDLRLAEHARRATAVAGFLRQHASVQRVICPHDPDDRHHGRFSRDFSGGNGLVSVILKRFPDDQVTSMVEGFRMFRIGASWGGTHSLVAPVRASSFPWLAPEEQEAWLLRLHVGLEPFDGLMRDLKDGFAQLTNG